MTTDLPTAVSGHFLPLLASDRALTRNFCFGLGWTLLHLIETAPNWPEAGELENSANEWVQLLKIGQKMARGWVSSTILLQRGGHAGSKNESGLKKGGP